MTKPIDLDPEVDRFCTLGTNKNGLLRLGLALAECFRNHDLLHDLLPPAGLPWRRRSAPPGEPAASTLRLHHWR